jgi:hypothetical protein
MASATDSLGIDHKAVYRHSESFDVYTPRKRVVSLFSLLRRCLVVLAHLELARSPIVAARDLGLHKVSVSSKPRKSHQTGGRIYAESQFLQVWNIAFGVFAEGDMKGRERSLRRLLPVKGNRQMEDVDVCWWWTLSDSLLGDRYRQGCILVVVVVMVEVAVVESEAWQMWQCGSAGL